MFRLRACVGNYAPTKTENRNRKIILMFFRVFFFSFLPAQTYKCVHTAYVLSDRIAIHIFPFPNSQIAFIDVIKNVVAKTQIINFELKIISAWASIKSVITK